MSDKLEGYEEKYKVVITQSEKTDDDGKTYVCIHSVIDAVPLKSLCYMLAATLSNYISDFSKTTGMSMWEGVSYSVSEIAVRLDYMIHEHMQKEATEDET